MLPVFTKTSLLHLCMTMLSTLAKTTPAPATLWGSSDITLQSYDANGYLTEIQSTTNKGPVLFPNDAPPPPRPPLIVTARPLAESIARSELNTTLINNTSPTPSNVFYITPKPRFMLKQKYKSLLDGTKVPCGVRKLGNEESKFAAISFPDSKEGDAKKKINVAEKRFDVYQHSTNSETTENNDYAFSYTVRVDTTGDDYSHKQKTRGVTTQGEYKVQLPDGRLQIVSYTADKNGYKADVKYKSNTLANDKEYEEDVYVTPKEPLFTADNALFNKYKSVVNHLVTPKKQQNLTKSKVPDTTSSNEETSDYSDNANSIFHSGQYNTRFPFYSTPNDLEKYNNNLHLPKIDYENYRDPIDSSVPTTQHVPQLKNNLLQIYSDNNQYVPNFIEHNHPEKHRTYTKRIHNNHRIVSTKKPDRQRSQYYDLYDINKSPSRTVSFPTQQPNKHEEFHNSINNHVYSVKSKPIFDGHDYSEFVTPTSRRNNAVLPESKLVSQHKISEQTPISIKKLKGPHTRHKYENLDLGPNPWLPDYTDIVNNSPSPFQLDYHDVTPQLFPALEDTSEKFKSKSYELHGNNNPISRIKTILLPSPLPDYRDILSDKQADALIDPSVVSNGQKKSKNPSSHWKSPLTPIDKVGTKKVFSNVYKSKLNHNSVTMTPKREYEDIESFNTKYGNGGYTNSLKSNYNFGNSALNTQNYIQNSRQVSIFTPTANPKKVHEYLSQPYEREIYVTPPNRFVSSVSPTDPPDDYVEKYSSFDMKLQLDPAILNEYNDAAPQKYVKVKHNINIFSKNIEQNNLLQSIPNYDDSKNKLDYDYVAGDFASTPFKDYSDQNNQGSKDYNNDYSFEEDHINSPSYSSKYSDLFKKDDDRIADTTTPTHVKTKCSGNALYNFDCDYESFNKKIKIANKPKIEIKLQSKLTSHFDDSMKTLIQRPDNKTRLTTAKFDKTGKTKTTPVFYYTESEFEPWEHDHEKSLNSVMPTDKNIYFDSTTTAINLQTDPNFNITTKATGKESVLITPKSSTAPSYKISFDDFEPSKVDIVNITPKTYLETTISRLNNGQIGNKVLSKEIQSRIYSFLKQIGA